MSHSYLFYVLYYYNKYGCTQIMVHYVIKKITVCFAYSNINILCLINNDYKINDI